MGSQVCRDGDDAPSIPKADVVSIQSSYEQCPASFCPLPPYSYTPLDIGRKEIRLLKLQAPIESQPLRGNIIHLPFADVPLSTEMPYWALSYCWGSLAGKRTIILDGMKLQITANLDDALRQLGNSYGMLWVDAICINQEDIPEKSREIRRMMEIYFRASGVVTWLGVANKTSDRAMDFLQVLATKAPRSQYDEYVKQLPAGNVLGKFGEEWIALKDLAMNGYWSRTWIIQELALCLRSKIVHCGTKSLPWDNFVNIFDVRINGGIFTTCILRVASVFQELPEVATGLQNLVSLSRSKDELEHGLQLTSAHVIHVFRSYSTFLATDPRDKVYGMLGMIVELRELVPDPNYANSKGEVFRDLTKAMLASGYNLDLICLKEFIHTNQSDDVSWVPNWDVRGLWDHTPAWLFQAIQDNKSRGPYAADAGKDAIISYVGDGSILRVRGISYDKVDGLGSIDAPNWPLSTKEAKRFDVVEPNHKRNAYGSLIETFKALKQLSQEIFRLWVSDAAQLGYSLNNECLIPRVYRQRAFMTKSEIMRYMRWVQRTEKFGFMGQSLQWWYELAYAYGQVLPIASSMFDFHLDLELDRMMQSIERVIHLGWRWLSTNRGYLGHIHPQARKGDEIVIIQGCTVPVVLRPCGEHYSVVCAAYVQGIMNGEALQGVTDDQMRYFNLA